MLIDNFNRTLNTWIEALDRYDLKTLYTKPSPQSWSLGQVYSHIINDTTFYIGQIKICAATDEYAHDEMSPDGKTMLLKNDFPDEMLEGPSTNSVIPQPESKEQLIADLLKLKADMNAAFLLMSKSLLKGKTKHPALHYFSAEDWLQFAEMHLRHHFRQKKRIDDFLTKKENYK